MVNNPDDLWILKGLTPPPLPLNDENRMIANGPVFDLDKVKKVLVDVNLWVINEVAHEDIETRFLPPMDEDEIKAVILSLREDLHDKSQWARTSAGQTLASDAYTIKWNRSKRIEWKDGLKLYVKFGYRPNHLNCLIVSFHPAKY